MAKNSTPLITLYRGSSYEPFAQTDSFTLDYAYGDEENDFELTIDKSGLTDTSLTAFRLEGSTDIAGYADAISSACKNGYYVITFKGTSLQGVLDKRIIEPKTGADYYAVKGSLSTIVQQVLADTQLAS